VAFFICTASRREEIAVTDEELVRAFEDASLPAAEFSHAAHVRVAWWYLKHGGLAGALARFPPALCRFAAAHGASNKYHETITVAYLLIIAERLDGRGELLWEAFAAENPDLLTNRPSPLSQYYTDDTLRSPRARRVFVMPDAAR